MGGDCKLGAAAGLRPAKCCTLTLTLGENVVAKGKTVALTVDKTGGGDGTITLTVEGNGVVTFSPSSFAPADCPKQVTVTGTTVSQSVGDTKIKGTWKNSQDQVVARGEVTLTVVTISKLQYTDGTSWVDITGTIYVMVNTTVTFKAVIAPAGATWPSGKPVWDGTAGASGSGETNGVPFNAKGDKTVTAECGDTVTANVKVYGLIGVQTADEWLSGRADTTYGVGEVVLLNYVVDPAGITAAQMGGLSWVLADGDGTLVNDGTSGTGTYTAYWADTDVTLRLVVLSGPSTDHCTDVHLNVVKPTGTHFEQYGVGVKHKLGHGSVGFRANIYLLPKDVSFANIDVAEDSVAGVLGGWYVAKFPNGCQHAATDPPSPVRNGNATTGCLVEGVDLIWSEWMDPPPDYAAGTLHWAIPICYSIGGGGWVTINPNDQDFSINAAGGMTAQKAGVGPFSKDLNDLDSSW